VEDDALALGAAAQTGADLLDLVDGRVERLFVARARLPALVLRLQQLADGVERLLRRLARRIGPTFELSARRRLLCVCVCEKREWIKCQRESLSFSLVSP
jgi:hypothetical protein